MKNLLLRIYDYFAVHRRALWIGFAVVFAALVALAATLRYNEDIMDFLPITEEERAALDAYQSQDAAAQLVLIIDGGEEDRRYDALDEIEVLLSAQGYQLSLEMDPTEQIAELYAQLPCLIADSVYDRFDSLFTPEAVRAALLRDRTILNTPGSSFLAPAIQNDPLGLVQLPSFQTSLASSKNYAFLESPYGGTETQKNAALVDSLQAATEAIAASFPELNIRWTGAPVIAVGNARRIKTDTLLCISLSAVLIILLLAYAFPRRRDICLILLSVSVGWVTGMAVLHMITPAVSAVVLGIGSVLIGIAVNYPLHLLVHQRYTSSVRQTLDEVLSPLIVGNITTVGAFLTLVPMQATALRHLGIFASAMLVGTILFCLFVLPHLMSADPTRIREIKFPFVHRTSSSAHCPLYIVHFTLFLCTILAGLYLWLCPYDRFDSNLNHINYMTAQQREDMSAFDVKTDDAARWADYWSSHDPQALIATIRNEAAAAGFRPEAFQPFYDHLTSVGKDATKISVGGLMAKISERLSDNFDYIGACCSLIVFIFLWISFKRFSLALIAFVPMALSWIWILAIMQLCSLQFNIVNIILATFIFGQGDDYTIFIVEGILYERRTGKAILPQYRQSIILSALIMLIGIGILVFAVHPAMHSLGVVTLIGMAVVLLMAFTVPPFLYSMWQKISNNKYVSTTDY